MKLLRNPIFAAVVCVLVVLLSTRANVRREFVPRAAAVSEQFYTENGPASQLSAYCDTCTSLAYVADAHGLDSFLLQESISSLRSSLASGKLDRIQEDYSETGLWARELASSLSRETLSDEESRTLLSFQTAALDADAYNQSVRHLLDVEMNGFSRMMARLCGVRLPVSFS